MDDRVGYAVFVFAALAAGLWFYTATLSAPPGAAPDATFEVETDLENDTLVVEHAEGEPFESGRLAVLVYEDRPVVPDRTVHRTTWETRRLIQPGDRLELEDPRLESGHRLVVRWFGEEGQTNVHVEEL